MPNAEHNAISAAISQSGGYLGQAVSLLADGESMLPQTVAFCDAFIKRDAVALLEILTAMEKLKRDQLIPVLQQWVSVLEEGLACRVTGQAITAQGRQLSAGRGSADLLGAITQLQKCMEYARGNVSCAAICGWLQWALR